MRSTPIAIACILAAAPATGVGAQDFGSNDFQRCVDVSIGGERAAYGCINQLLRRRAEEARANSAAAPLAAGSQDVRVGAVNIPAVKQQYGRNFGISPYPERPPQIYSAPLGPRQ